MNTALLVVNCCVFSDNFFGLGMISVLTFTIFSAHKFAQAIDLYTQAIEVNSQNAVYWANRSIAHLKLEEYGSAIQDASKAIEVDPKYSKACFVP